MKKRSHGAGMSRRDVLKAGALAGVAAVTGGGLGARVASASEARRLGKPRKKTGDLILVNGRIHTMDERNRVARSVTIREGRFVEVGDHPRPRLLHHSGCRDPARALGAHRHRRQGHVRCWRGAQEGTP